MEEYIVITGASSGIGYHMALQLAEKGKNLILVARNKERLKKVHAEITSLYDVTVHYIIKDL